MTTISIILMTILLSGCVPKIPPKYVPVTTAESGTFTVYHSSPTMVWRTNTWVLIDGKWFYGFTGNDYKRERVTIGDHSISVGVNSGMKAPDLESYQIHIKKNTDTCIEVSPDIEGFYWVDALGVNKTTLNWKMVTPEECEKAINIRERK